MNDTKPDESSPNYNPNQTPDDPFANFIAIVSDSSDEFYIFFSVMCMFNTCKLSLVDLVMM